MKPARLVAPPNTGETRTLVCARADSCHSGVLTLYPASEWQRPQFLAGLASLGAARRLTEQRDAMGVLPGWSGRIICPKSHHPRHPFSGFQSTDDPVFRNTDTLKSVVVTETGRTSVKAAPLTLPGIEISHGHRVLQSSHLHCGLYCNGERSTHSGED